MCIKENINEKLKYETPIAELVTLETEDVIQTSGFLGEEDEFEW